MPAIRQNRANIRAAALDRTPINGLTHRFYRYPARFSPAFAAACIEAYSKPGDVVLDCGAHHGFASLLFSSWVGESGRITAFEPLPHNADIVQKNIELNSATNIVLERKAVGSRHGRTKIAGISNSSILHAQESGVDVEVVCLDDYAHLSPTFLKIDVEGFEAEVLKGAQTILATKPKLALEIHTDQLGQYDTSVAELFGLLDLDAYELRVQWQDTADPVVYAGEAISNRVHLYAIPKP